MKVCIIGNGLVGLTLANVLIQKNLSVDILFNSKNKKYSKTRTLGISKSNIDYFNKEKIIINSGLNYTIFRPSYIVGKDDLFTKFLKKQIKLKIIEIPGSGNYSIQPISINDVVKVFLQSLDQIKFKNKIIDLVGPDYLTFEQYVKLFSKDTKTKIKKINLENAYYDAITNSKSNFGVDDLNILIGDFKGNYDKLQKITQMKFESVIELLKSGRLL